MAGNKNYLRFARISGGSQARIGFPVGPHERGAERKQSPTNDEELYDTSSRWTRLPGALHSRLVALT
jgi:hypothetical protein